jgi:hypothetical protein
MHVLSSKFRQPDITFVLYRNSNSHDFESLILPEQVDLPTQGNAPVCQSSLLFCVSDDLELLIPRTEIALSPNSTT